MDKLKELDAFTKIDPTHSKPSFTGAVTTMVMYSLVGLLFLYQIYHFFTSTTEVYRNVVDSTTVHSVPLHIDIMVASECSRLRVELLEKGGKTKNVSNLLEMQDVQSPDEQLDNAFDNEQQQDWLMSFLKNVFSIQRAEGSCRIHGSLDINKYTGTFSVVSQRFFINHPLGIITISDPSINFSHKVHKFSFGPRLPDSKHVNNGMEKGKEIYVKELHSFNYFVSIVPINYKSLTAKTNSYQHSVSQFAKRAATTTSESGNAGPGIFVRYDFDPMSLDISVARQSIRTLLVKFLGIVGGIFTLSKVIYLIVDFVLENILFIRPTKEVVEEEEEEPLITSSTEFE